VGSNKIMDIDKKSYFTDTEMFVQRSL